MKIHTLIVDDEPLARTRLSRILLSFDDIQVVGSAKDGQEAIELSNKLKPSLIFMDIQMPKKSGLDAAKEIIANNQNPPAIIFCTAFDQYAINAFDLNATSYLLKPASKQDIKRAIDQAVSLSKLQIKSLIEQVEPQDSILLKESNAVEKLALEHVCYFNAEDKNVIAGLEDGRQAIVDMTLKELELKYPNELMRIHRSILVNKEKLQKLIKNETNNYSVLLNGIDQHLQVSRRCLNEVKSYFA